MPLNTSDREHLHQLVVDHYGNQKQQDRARCTDCGENRVLGQRGPGRGKCKKCKVEGLP